MNITLYDDYLEAERDADEYAGTTGITHLVIEKFRRPGAVIDLDLNSLLGPDLSRAEHVFTVLSEVEWNLVSDKWDAEVQYEARMDSDWRITS